MSDAYPYPTPVPESVQLWLKQFQDKSVHIREHNIIEEEPQISQKHQPLENSYIYQEKQNSSSKIHKGNWLEAIEDKHKHKIHRSIRKTK